MEHGAPVSLIEFNNLAKNTVDVCVYCGKCFFHFSAFPQLPAIISIETWVLQRAKFVKRMLLERICCSLRF